MPKWQQRVFMWCHIKPILQVIILATAMLVSSLQGAVLENTTKSVTFYLVHTTIPNYNWVTRILANTLGGNFNSFYEVNQKFKRFLLFFSIPRHTKRKPSGGAKSSAYGCVPPHANPKVGSGVRPPPFLFYPTLFIKASLILKIPDPHPFSNLYVSYIHFWWHPIALLIYHFTYFQPEDIPIFSILFCKYKCTTWKSEEPHPL